MTDKILPVVKEWQQRSLEAVYAVVYPDAIHYHVRSEGQIIKKKDLKALIADLKAVYAAADGPAALDSRSAGTGNTPRSHDPGGTTGLICTANTVEGFDRQLRKVTKSKCG